MGRAFVEEVFQGRETMGVRDVGVEGSDINCRHNGVEKLKYSTLKNYKCLKAVLVLE